MPVQKNSMESMGSIQRGKWGMQDGSRETELQVGSRKLKIVLSTACGRQHAKELSFQRRSREGPNVVLSCVQACIYLPYLVVPTEAFTRSI